MTAAAALRPPDGRQGPGPMPGALLKVLDLALARRAGGALPGDHLAPGAGAGTELVQLRPYQVGDDVRQLDAAATARTGVPHVRLQVPGARADHLDRARRLAVDGVRDRAAAEGRRGRGRGARGRAARHPPRRPRGADPRRRARREDAAAARRSPRPARDRARRGRGRRPRCGTRFRHSRRARPWVGLRSAGRPSPAGIGPLPMRGSAEPGALARALVRAGRVARRPGLVVVVSDFREDGWRGPLATLAARHSIVAVEVRDPREAELPRAGQLALVDPETGAPDRGRQRAPARARALRAARGRAPRVGGRRPPHRPRRAHRPRHRPRLAARARPRVRPPRRARAPPARRPPRRSWGGRMSFAAPLFLLGLLVLPAGAALQLLATAPSPALRRALPRRARRRGRRRRRAGLAPLRARRAARASAPAPSCSRSRGRRRPSPSPSSRRRWSS